ncbi:hypothetical protein AVEN_16748-1 [Araneus ventricosus]|uniref:Uncharacterized protein n=1 Tax=Araneus ventricosus TaxID=182803 RepID=A0A4Y2LT93_ARAVE|nr:hypothetical protein AVEN_16748-1 [Araneus ventricosus]
MRLCNASSVVWMKIRRRPGAEYKTTRLHSTRLDFEDVVVCVDSREDLYAQKSESNGNAQRTKDFRFKHGLGEIFQRN